MYYFLLCVTCLSDSSSVLLRNPKLFKMPNLVVFIHVNVFNYQAIIFSNRLCITDNVVKSFQELMTAHKGYIVGKVNNSCRNGAATAQEV